MWIQVSPSSYHQQLAEVLWVSFGESSSTLQVTLVISYTQTFFLFYFISDTVGNLIAFSDGTFSGETADHDEVEMMELPKTTASIISMVTAPEETLFPFIHSISI